MKNVKEFIVDYLEREYNLPADCDFQTFDFVRNGYVDSIGIIQFIASLEDEFNIEFEDEDLENEENHVLGRLIALVEKKISEKA